MMKTKYLSSFLTSALLALGMTSIAGVPKVTSESTATVISEPIFSCQLSEGTPTTVAKTSDDRLQPVFHWNLDEVPTLLNPQQLCDSVSQKLNNYLAEGNDLSSLTFKAGVTFQEEEPVSLPAICVADRDEPCKLLLFTLEPSERPDLVANDVLVAILDKDLQTSPVASPTRGIQSIGYKVNLWQLLGF